MRIKRIMNIGDTFLTWVVVELVNPKKYRYKCRCSECGVEKEFIKYNLLKGSYAPCKGCGHKKINNVSLIRKHWNCELNGVLFDAPESFSLTQSYWFVCDKGHNFKCNIKDFSLERCLGCKEIPPNHPSKTQAKEYALQYFKALGRVVEYAPFMIYIEDFTTMVHIVEGDRYSSYRNYFGSEQLMIEELDKTNSIESELRSQGVDFVCVKIENNLKNNVDKFKELMVTLVHKLD